MVGVVALALSRRDLLLLGLVATVPWSTDNSKSAESDSTCRPNPCFSDCCCCSCWTDFRVRLDAGLEAHPITRCIQVMFVWLAITGLTSSTPWSRSNSSSPGDGLWSAFLLAGSPGSSDRKNAFSSRTSSPCSPSSSTPWCAAGYGFEKQAGHWALTPSSKTTRAMALCWPCPVSGPRPVAGPGRSALGSWD